MAAATRPGASRSAMSGKRRNAADGPIPFGPGAFGPWRRWLALVVEWHHGLQSAWPETKIAAVKWCKLIALCSYYGNRHRETKSHGRLYPAT